MTITQTLRSRARSYRDLAQRVLATVGVRDSDRKVIDDAQHYWTDPSSNRWRSDSHWRDSEVFTETDKWDAIGLAHLELFDRLSRTVNRTEPIRGVVEWGCGGGANAVTFAPRGSSFTGVDVSQESLDECARQVEGVTSVPFRPVLVDVADPEGAVPHLLDPCDLFICLYVFELIPSQEYGARLLRIAQEILAPGGLAFIQIKYDTGDYRTQPRLRSYRTAVADMTTYRIDAFWSLAEACGFRPEMVYLVPRNNLDERYAYFLLSKSA